MPNFDVIARDLILTVLNNKKVHGFTYNKAIDPVTKLPIITATDINGIVEIIRSSNDATNHQVAPRL